MKPAKEKPLALPTFTCLRCGATWIPRKPIQPTRCGACRSPYWDRPRKPEHQRTIEDIFLEEARKAGFSVGRSGAFILLRRRHARSATKSRK